MIIKLTALMKGKFDLSSVSLAIILDVETTGLSDNDELIEVALILFEFDRLSGEILKVVDTYSALREPLVEIGLDASKLHGLHKEDLNGKDLDYSVIVNLLKKAELVITHNAEFDKSFLSDLFTGLDGLKWVCSMRDLDWYQEGLESKSLNSIAKHYSIDVLKAHRAMNDALVLFEILKKPNSNQVTNFTTLFRYSLNLVKNFRFKSCGEDILINEIYLNELKLCKVGARIILWTKEDLSFINGYRPSSVGGQGKVFKFLKSENEYLSNCISQHTRVWVEVTSNDETEIGVRIGHSN